MVKTGGGQIFPHDSHCPVQQLIPNRALLQLGGDFQMESTSGALLAVVQPIQASLPLPRRTEGERGGGALNQRRQQLRPAARIGPGVPDAESGLRQQPG